MEGGIYVSLRNGMSGTFLVSLSLLRLFKHWGQAVCSFEEGSGRKFHQDSQHTLPLVSRISRRSLQGQTSHMRSIYRHLLNVFWNRSGNLYSKSFLIFPFLRFQLFFLSFFVLWVNIYLNCGAVLMSESLKLREEHSLRVSENRVLKGYLDLRGKKWRETG